MPNSSSNQDSQNEMTPQRKTNKVIDNQNDKQIDMIQLKTRPEQMERNIIKKSNIDHDDNNEFRKITKLSRRRNGEQQDNMKLRFYLVITLALVANYHTRQVECQCPMHTMTSFERIGGVTIKDTLPILYQAPNISSSNNQKQIFGMGSAGSSGGGSELSRGGFATSQMHLSSSATIPITAECNNRCRRSIKCRAFLVDYSRHACYAVEQQQGLDNPVSLMKSPQPIHLVPTQDRTAYFEKVCLALPTFECERAWIYERVMGYQIYGHDDKIIEDVSSRLKCQEHCLSEREFRCRSGEYDYLSMQCRLSIVDRHLKPNLFRPTANNVDYFENQCVPVGNQCDAFDRFEDLDLGRAEIMRMANTSDQCQQFCTQTIKAFICRSFTWDPLLGRCYLNSANTMMVGGVDRLIPAPGLTYYQRNDCIDLKLECDTNAMTLNLRTNEPFRGRMYVRDDPNSCETVGRAALGTSLSIPFQSQGGRCAQRELPSRYSSVVVVQQHPLIQRKSDRYIKVVCDFQTSNKTITSTYNVVANPWTSTALINSTSFAPKIRLRITDKNGADITGAKLGDELYLRIEAETESVYDMVARSVYAKSGGSDESIELVDKDGCPTDPRIFPALKKFNRRTILGKFDAFKFSSDAIVRFQVDVQFCLNQCPIITCDSSNLPLLNTNPDQIPSSSAGEVGAYTPGLASITTPSPPAAPMLADLPPGLPSTFTISTQQLPPVSPNMRQQEQQHNNHHRHQQQHHHYQQHQRIPSSGSGGSSSSSDVGGSSTGSNGDQVNSGNSHQFNGQLPVNFYHNGRYPSAPANQPLGSSLVEPSNSMSSANGDSPSFDVQPRSAHQNHQHTGKSVTAETKGRGISQQQQQVVTSNLISPQQEPQDAIVSADSHAVPPSPVQQSNLESAAATAAAIGGSNRQQQQQQRRRRRSTEPIPDVPKHVPLETDIFIIVEPSNTSGDSKARTGSGQDGRLAGKSKSTQQQQQVAGARRDARKTLDGQVNRNEPTYDLSGKYIGSNSLVEKQ